MALSSNPLFQRTRRIGGRLDSLYNLIMYYVYVLQVSNGNTYTGSTSDIKKRLLYHQKGKVPSTKPYRPLKLLYFEAYSSKKDALRREKYLKTGDGRKKIKKQLKHTLMALSSNG